MTFDPTKKITRTCVDHRYDYKPQISFRFNGDGGRDDMEEAEEAMNWTFDREKKDPHREFTVTASVEGG